MYCIWLRQHDLMEYGALAYTVDSELLPKPNLYNDETPDMYGFGYKLGIWR